MPAITQLDRYILRQLLASLAAVTTALVALIWLTQSLRFVELVVNRGLSLRVFLQLTGLLIPNFVAVILPITTYVAVQFFVYQRLLGDRELTVMRAAGLSPWALSRPALLAGCLAMALGFVLNMVVVPAANTEFKEFQFELRNKVAAFLLQEGVFTPISDQLTVYVRSRDRDGTLRGIMVEDDRQANTRATILAESGRLVAESDTPRVLLENGSRQEIDAKTGRLDVLTFAEDTLDLATGAHGEDAQRSRDDSELSLPELLHPSAAVVARGDAGKFLVEAHRRLTQPLTTIGFTLLALATVLTGSFRRAGNLLRPLAGVLAIVALLAIGLTAQSLAARHPVLLPLIWVQALLPGAVCAWLLFMPAVLAGPPPAAACPAHSRLAMRQRSQARPDRVMKFALTLSLYIARQFTWAALAMLSALSLLVMLFDFIELLRRAAIRTDVGFGLVVGIALLRLPYYMLQILPFAVLLGGIIAFWRLTRSSELIVARAAGVSAWQFLSLPVASALCLGLLASGGLSPLSSVMFARAEALDNVYLRHSGGPLSLSGGQLWLRQADHGLDKQGVAIIHARDVALQGKVVAANDVSVYRLDSGDHLLSRVEAAHAILRNRLWLFSGARTIEPDHLPVVLGNMQLATELTARRVQESFQSPETLSVWALPGFIALLESAGFSSVRHRLHYQALLALPLLCGTMALVAAGFSMRQTRRGGVARMVGSGVAAGFALFTLSKIAEEFGQSGALPAVMAAWAPAAAGLMLSVSLLLHLEDG